MPLPGFKMANELKAAPGTPAMANGDDDARPKRARKWLSRSKLEDAEQGSLQSTGKRSKPDEGGDGDEKTSRPGTQSSSDVEGRQDPEGDDVGAGGLTQAVGENGGPDMAQINHNGISNIPAGGSQRSSIDAGHPSPARSRGGGGSGRALCSPNKRKPNNSTSTGCGGGGGGGSTSNSTSNAISGTKRDKPTTGLLRSLMIGPVQDRGSTMDIYRPSLISASASTSSSLSLPSANPSPWRKTHGDQRAKVENRGGVPGGDSQHHQGLRSPTGNKAAARPAPVDKSEDVTRGDQSENFGPLPRQTSERGPSSDDSKVASSVSPSAQRGSTADKSGGISPPKRDRGESAEIRSVENSAANESGGRIHPARVNGNINSGGPKGSTSQRKRREGDSGSVDAEASAQPDNAVPPQELSPSSEIRCGASSNGSTQEDFQRGEDAGGWVKPIGSSEPGVQKGGSSGPSKGVPEEGYERGVVRGGGAECREKSYQDGGSGGHGGPAVGMTEGDNVELHLIRQFQGWNGHKQRQLNMRQEEHQFTRWQQQHLQQQRMLEQQLEMLRISHLQLRRQQQDQPIVRGQGSGSNDACGGPGARNPPTRHPMSMPGPLPMPFAPLPSQLQEQHQLERRHQLVDGRGSPQNNTACHPYSGQEINADQASPSMAHDTRALGGATTNGPPGPDSHPDHRFFSGPERQHLPPFRPASRGLSDTHAQYYHHQQRQQQHQLNPSGTVSIGYLPPSQGAAASTPGNVHNPHPDWPRHEEPCRAPPPQQGSPVPPTSVNGGSRGGPIDFGNGNVGGGFHGGNDVVDHTEAAVALASVKAQLDRAMTALRGVYAQAGDEVARNRIIQSLQSEIDATRAQLAMAKTANAGVPVAAGAAPMIGNPNVYPLDGTNPASFAASKHQPLGPPPLPHMHAPTHAQTSAIDGSMTAANPSSSVLQAETASRAVKTTNDRDRAMPSLVAMEVNGHATAEGNNGEVSVQEERPRRGSSTIDVSSIGDRGQRQVAPTSSAAQSGFAAVVSPRDAVPLTNYPPPSAPSPAPAMPPGSRPGYVGECISNGSGSDTSSCRASADFAESTPPPRAIPGSPAGAAAPPIALDAASERAPGGVCSKGRKSRSRSSWGGGTGLELIVEASTKLSELEKGYSRQQENARALEREKKRSNDLEADLERTRNCLRESDAELKDRNQTISRLSVEVAQNAEVAESMRGQLASLKTAVERMEEHLVAKDVEIKRLASEIAHQRQGAGPAAISSFSSGLYGPGSGVTEAAVPVSLGGNALGGSLPTENLSRTSTQHHPQQPQLNHQSRQQYPAMSLPPPVPRPPQHLQPRLQPQYHQQQPYEQHQHQQNQHQEQPYDEQQHQRYQRFQHSLAHPAPPRAS